MFGLLLWRAYTAARQDRASAALPPVVYSLSLGWFVLIFRGIWRSAGNYRGPKIWGTLARLGVLVGTLRMATEAAILFPASRKQLRSRP